MALKTARYPNVGRNLTYPTLGLIGEVGEVAEIWATQGLTDSTKGENLLEYGDVLWYYATACHELGLELSALPAYRSFYVDTFQGLQRLFPTAFTTWEDVKPMANEMVYKACLCANIVKKIQRDDAGNLTEEKRRLLLNYLSNSFVSWANLLCQFDVDLNQVALDNIKKLNG
jgi:NTP pyrophosphatase (non-canonical NTP hydrolase)